MATRKNFNVSTATAEDQAKVDAYNNNTVGPKPTVGRAKTATKIATVPVAWPVAAKPVSKRATSVRKINNMSPATNTAAPKTTRAPKKPVEYINGRTLDQIVARASARSRGVPDSMLPFQTKHI